MSEPRPPLCNSVINAKPTQLRKSKVGWVGKAYALNRLYFVEKTESRIRCIDEVGLSGFHSFQVKLVLYFFLSFVREAEYTDNFASPYNAPTGRFIPEESVAGLKFVIRPEFLGPHVEPYAVRQTFQRIRKLEPFAGHKRHSNSASTEAPNRN